MEPLIVVIDLGKTLAKATLWTATGGLVDRQTRANRRVDAGRHVALDVDGIDEWLGVTLRGFGSMGRVGAIVPVGHGAAAVITRGDEIVIPPIDYEERLGNRDSYERERSAFRTTGSPSLPDGLNLGAQLHHYEQLDPTVFGRGARILLWPQYWAWRLSGVAASEVTSLGCHTDLWEPTRATPSALAKRRGWDAALPPLRRAADVLGAITGDWARRTGLPEDVRVHCGLHDSNAALLAARGFREIADHEATVLSTGTWFVAMRSPARGSKIDPGSVSEARDCLVNVDAHGSAIPSARFMGGREIELLTGLDTRRVDIKPDQPALVAAVDEVLESAARVLPTFAPGFGPFPDARGRWIEMPTDQAARRAAVCLYAALVADASLDLIGAEQRILVEGRFAEAEVFVRALASLRPGDAVLRSNVHNDVSYGALRLLNPELRPSSPLETVKPLDADLVRYRALWRRDVERAEIAA